MSYKGRIAAEDKIKAVEEYLSGTASTYEIAQKYSVGQTTVCSWIRLYKIRGKSELTPSERSREYSIEIKRHAVQDYLTGSFLLSDICVKYDISSHGMLQNWIKQYNGHKDFREPKSEGVVYVAKGCSTTLEERIEIGGARKGDRRRLSLVRLENQYLAVQALHKEKNYPVAVLCDILKLNRSSYYKWLRCDGSEREARDAALIERICQLYQEANGIFGYRRMQLNLKRRFGLLCNKKRVYRVMQAIGIKSVIRRKRPSYVRTTPEITSENILNRKFTANNLNEKWLTDVTEFKCTNGEKLTVSTQSIYKGESIQLMYVRTLQR